MPSTKKVKRILNRSICIVFSLIVVLSSLPVSAFALDPVSTITMANAFAQAITAYGASHGVSMIFDVTNTSQIGENVHELWKRFRSGQQTIDDYMEIAAAIWPSLYNKVVDAGKAYVGIRLAAEYVSDLDEFYDWLLSGPAELVKVDNQYYEWTLNDFNQVTPIIVSEYSDSYLGNIQLIKITAGDQFYDTRYDPVKVYTILTISPSNDVYGYFYSDNQNSTTSILMAISDPGTVVTYSDNNNDSTNRILDSTLYVQYSSDSEYVSYYPSTYRINSVFTLKSSDYPVQVVNSRSNYIGYEYEIPNDGVIDSENNSSISVAPYVGEASPDDVYIPDTNDPDYGPLPYFGPLNIPWLDVYGNGIDSLTDAQSEAITNKLDDVISQLKTLYLEGDGVLDNADTQFYDTFHSILPFTNLPSFRLNLSGIWHYVVSWVGTLSSWLTLMFQVWSNIPFQFSIPVYASAVVVIVLGVYKRFFM